MNSEEKMRKIYDELEGRLIKPFDKFFEEAIVFFESKIYQKVAFFKILERIKKTFPDFPCRISGMEDRGNIIELFNVPLDEKMIVTYIVRGIIELEDYDDKLDLLVSTKTPETTENHYRDVIAEIKETS